MGDIDWRNYKPKSDTSGALLYFKKGVSVEEVKKRLEALKDIIDWQKVDDFDSNIGGPVWYIP